MNLINYLFSRINRKLYSEKNFTHGYIIGREPLRSDFYDINYYSGKKKHMGISYPSDGSYLDPESTVKYKFIDLVRWVNQYLDTAKILDIGAGPGHFTYWSKKMGKKFLIDSCDISKELKKHASNHNNNYFICDATDLNIFKERTFDGVLLFDVLEHLSPNGANLAVKEASRILAPNGYIFIRIPNRETWNRKTWRDTAHVWLPNIHELKTLISGHGFDKKTMKATTRGFPFSKIFFKSTGKDPRLPVLGSTILLVAQKSA